MAHVSHLWGCELPDDAITWYDSNDNVVDFSAGWTFTAKLGAPASPAVITKTTGITGAATSPNVTIAWTTAELSSLPNQTATYALQVIARRTSDSKDRPFPQPISFTILPAVT